MEFLKVKKRYNKFISWLLAEFSSFLIQGVAGWIMVVVMATKNTQAIDLTSSKEAMLMMAIVPIIGLIGMVLTTFYINKRTPKGERVQTWLRAFWMGWKVVIKISLMFTVILIPFLIKWSIGYYEYDYTGKINGVNTKLKKIGDNLYEDMNGNKYTSDR